MSHTCRTPDRIVLKTSSIEGRSGRRWVPRQERAKSARRAVICCACAGALLSAFASAPGQVQDYSAGFAKFYQYGLPDVGEAQYVQLNTWPMPAGMEHRIYDLGAEGNAWLLGETNGVGRFVLQGGRQLEVTDGSKAAAEGISRMDQYRAGGVLYGAWQPADLGGDLEKTLAWLEEQAEEDSSSRWQLQQSGGDLFLFAIHSYAQGFTNEANRIAQMLFDMNEDRRQVLLQAMNALADGQYGEAVAVFSADGDWTAFRDSLVGLLQRYPVGWRDAPAVKILIERVLARIDEGPPALTGEHLGAEDHALAAQLVDVRDADFSESFQRGGIWLLGTPGGESTATGKVDVVQRILDRGMASLPLLIALVDDPTLTRINLQTVTRGYTSYRYYSGSRPLDPEVLYDQLKRPASRGDIATALLRTAVPSIDEDGDDLELSGDELREQAGVWYEAHGSQSTSEVAKAYLSEGTQAQRMAAITTLASGSDPADAAVVEGYFLGQEAPEEVIDSVMVYIGARGTNAAAFAAQFLEQARKRLDADSDDADGDDAALSRGREDWQLQNMKRQLTSLETIASGITAGEVLARIARGESELAAEQAALDQLLVSESVDGAIGLVLTAAAACVDPADSQTLLNWTPTMRYSARQVRGRLHRDDDEPDTPQLASHADTWRRLMDDSRTVPSDYYGTLLTVGESACWAVEVLYGSDENAAAISVAWGLGRRGRALVASRAQARVAGNTNALPALPAADALDEAACTALADRLLALTDARLAESVNALSLDELRALPEILETQSNLNARLAPLAGRIRTVNVWLEAPSAEALKALEGRTLDTPAVKQLIETARTLAGQGTNAMITAFRDRSLEGITLAIRPPPAQDATRNMFRAMTGDDTDGGQVTAQMSTRGGASARAIWPLSEAPPATVQTPPPADADSLADALLEDAHDDILEDIVNDSEDSREAFWTEIERVTGNQINACGMLYLAVTGTAGMANKETP